MQNRCSACGMVFKILLVLIAFNFSQGAETCIAGAKKRADFKYRWVGSDQWAAEHGCNVNIPKAYQKPGQPYYQIWGGYHTLNRLLPADSYFKVHPEYFSLYNNQRTPLQLCLSNPQVQKVVADNLIQLIRDHPLLDIVTLGPRDNRMFCQCPRCKAQDEKDPAPDQRYSRRVFQFYKNVSERVHLTFSDIIIRFGCYDVYAAPPKDKSITLPPQTYPLICHFQKYCLNHPIQDNRCIPNKRFRKIVTGWRELADKLFIYEYYYKVNWLDLPWPIVHSIRDDIGWYKQNGVVGFYSQYNPDSAGSLLNFQVAAALLGDVDANVDRLIDEFCREQFGPAWKEMKAYFGVLETAMINSGLHIPDRGFAFPHAVHVFTDEVIFRCKELVDAARAKVARSPFKENVEKYEKLMEYTRRCVAFLQLAVTALGEHGLFNDAGEVDRETVLAAFKKGNALGRYIQDNREALKGVIPSRETINPYLAIILHKLERRCGLRQDKGPNPQITQINAD